MFRWKSFWNKHYNCLLSILSLISFVMNLTAMGFCMCMFRSSIRWSVVFFFAAILSMPAVIGISEIKYRRHRRRDEEKSKAYKQNREYVEAVRAELGVAELLKEYSR